MVGEFFKGIFSPAMIYIFIALMPVVGLLDAIYRHDESRFFASLVISGAAALIRILYLLERISKNTSLEEPSAVESERR